MCIRWWTENLLRHRHRLKPVFFILLTALIVAVPGCSLLPEEDEEEVLPPITPPKLSQKPEYIVKTASLETKVRGVGKLMATQEESLFFVEDNKRVKDIYVKTGEKVEKGQIIAELDVSDLESQLRQKRLQFRRDELQMIQTLRKSNELDAEQIEQAKIDFELKREELANLEDSIKKAKLVAPFSGTLVALYIQKGDTVKAYETVAIVADLSKLVVAADINAEDLKKVVPGMEAVVDINNAGQFKGKVKQLPNPNKENNNNAGGGYRGGYDPYYNAGSQTKPDSIENYVIVELDRFPEGLTRGTPLSVSIIIQRKENALVIPPSALRSHAGRNYVLVVDEQGGKREVDVEIGQQTPTEVEIVKGLQAGQKVVGR